MEVLRDHRERQARKLGAVPGPTSFVFTTANATPIEPRNAVRSFKAVLRRAGLPKVIRFHDLRHSYASYLVRLGVHPRVVMEAMGHSQIALTMNTYSHVTSEQQREAANKVDGLLRQARVTKTG